MEKIYKRNRTISYLLYLGILFLLGWLVGDHVNINGLQEVLNTLINLDITTIFCVIVGIEVLFIILTVVIGIVKNLDAEKGERIMNDIEILKAKAKAKLENENSEKIKIIEKAITLYKENKEVFINDIENIIIDEIKEGKYYSEYYITGTYYLLDELKVDDKDKYDINKEIKKLIFEDIKQKYNIIELGGFPYILFENSLINNIKIRIEYICMCIKGYFY